MACSPTCGTAHAYADDISAMQASKTVQLFLKERLIEMKNLRVTVVGNEWENDIYEKEMIRPLEEKDIDTVCGRDKN